MKLDLHYSDCMTVLPKLLGVADLVLTDPPYRLTSGGGVPKYEGAQRMKGCFNSDKYSNDGNIVECDLSFSDWMPLVYASCAKDADAYMMANDKNINDLINQAMLSGFRLHNLLVWDKRNATPNRWYMKNCEFVFYGWKGRARPINDKSAKQVICCPQIDESSHPTEKPVTLMEHYIRNSTEPGATVLDPFMGSGTTGVACARTGRNFIGIEKNLDYFKTAQRRIAAALEQYGGKNVRLC